MRRGFSLIELMVGIALSSFIMLGLVQAYRNASHLLSNARTLLVMNRRIALLFNQVERDMTTAIVYHKPTKYVPAQRNGSRIKGRGYTITKKESEDQYVPSFALEVFEDGGYRHRNKKWQLTKKANVLTTTPLEVYGQQQERRVRVEYELVFDKAASTPQKSSYTLLRRQTSRLENASFKKKDEDDTSIVTHVVANKVHKFCLQAVYAPKPDEKAGASVAPAELVRSFTWGQKEETEKSATALPEYLSLHIELWDDDYAKTYSFECLLPLYVRDAYVKPKKDDRKGPGAANQKTDKPDAKDEENTDAQGDEKQQEVPDAQAA